MNTKITITYNGERYTLEFNRMTIKALEKAGFELDEFMKKPMTNIEMVFTHSFAKNHPRVDQNTIDAIYDSCADKQGLIAVLGKMINETYESLLSDGSGNAQWEVVSLNPTKKETNQG